MDIKKKLYIGFMCLILLSSTLDGKAFTVTTYTPNNYVVNNSNSETYPKISQIEHSLFNRSYENENIYNRLSRLERKIFRKSFKHLTLAQRLDNLNNTISQQNSITSIPIRELNSLENKVFGRTYNNEPIEYRLNRIEEAVLGTIQAGPLEMRYHQIRRAILHNNYTALDNYSYQNTNKNGFLGNLVNTLSNYFTPSLTGFTPQVYDNYIPPYNNGYTYRNYGYNALDDNLQQFNHFKNFNNYSGVKILD